MTGSPPSANVSRAGGRIYPWVVVGLLWFVALLNYMDRQMLSTMRDSMQVNIAELTDAVNFGRLMSVFLWIYGLISPAAGAVADRVSRKWLIVGSLFVWSAVTFGMGYAETFGQLYALRAVMGVSEALYIPAGLSLIADWHRDRSRSLAVGIHMTGLYAGQAIGGFGATVAAAFSWQTTFQGFGLVGMVYAVILILFLRENRQAVEERRRNRRTAATVSPVKNLLKSFGLSFSNVAFWAILFYFAAPSLPGWATKNWLPTLFSESLGLSMDLAGPAATITIAVSSFIGVIVGGILSDRWVRRNLRGRIYTGAIGLGMTIPSLLLLGFSHSLPGIIGSGVLFGVGYGMFDANNMPILCQFVADRYRATAYGIMNMIGVFAGAAVTQILGQWAQGNNLGAGFAWLSVIVAAAIAIQLLFLRPKTDNMTQN